MKKETVLDTLSFIVAVVTIILVVCLKSNFTYLILAGSIGSILYGLLASLNKNNYGYIFLSLGISALVTILLYMNKILDKSDSITFMITGSVFMLMIITLIFNYLNRKVNFKKYNMVVEGRVIDLVKNPNTKKEYFQPVYEFEVDGEVFNVDYPMFKNKFIPNIGDTQKIYVNSKDHKDVFFDKSTGEKIYDYALSAFLIIASLIIMITLFI